MQLRNRDDLTRLMRLKQYNYRSLAKAAGLHHSTIHRLHTGERPHCYIDTATRIADALGVAIAELFRSEGQNGASQVAK